MFLCLWNPDSPRHNWCNQPPQSSVHSYRACKGPYINMKPIIPLTHFSSPKREQGLSQLCSTPNLAIYWPMFLRSWHKHLSLSFLCCKMIILLSYPFLLSILPLLCSSHLFPPLPETALHWGQVSLCSSPGCATNQLYNPRSVISGLWTSFSLSVKWKDKNRPFLSYSLSSNQSLLHYGHP